MNSELNNINIVSKYWKRKILNREVVQELPHKQYSLPSVIIYKNDIKYFNKLTSKNPIAQYTVINAIFSFLLKKMINDFDGYIVSDHKEQHNPLLFSFPVDLEMSFKEYLQNIKNEVIETLKYSDYINSSILKKTRVSEISILSNYCIKVNSEIKSDCKGILIDIQIKENEDIEIKTSYLEGFVSKVLIEFINQCFVNFIIDLENNLAATLSNFSFLSEKEKSKILVDFNNTNTNYPKDKSIVDLFEEQVMKTPDNVAVVFGKSKLTFAQLNEKSNQLSNYIFSKHAVNKGDIIGVFLPKSDLGIISLLAVLKLGAVYLPIDTNYPQERIDYIIKDSNLKLLISADYELKIANCDILNIESIRFEDYSSENSSTNISPKDLAYVIYTSGSTGQPKGVMVEHSSNINMSLDQINFFRVNNTDKIVWFASVAFDASISEIMMSLYSGASLCIPTEEIIKDKDRFVKFLKETQASVITFPPSYLGLLSEDDISGLRCIITAGESANPTHAQAIVESGIDYYNAYGPTECAVCASIYKVTKENFGKSMIPIGRPISNSQIYILDDYLNPVSIGVTGKLYVSGAGVARGYLNKPELTAEKFMNNPFVEGKRMYDTGDLGCWLPDGNIEFLGRKDQQVKLRGYRIELGEIENAMLQYSEDLKQVVVEVKGENEEKVLVAYFVSATELDKSKLRSFLQNSLPDYMIPGFYIALEKLPLTPNGKIDRKALPNISGNDIIRKEYIAPESKTEKILVAIWQEVLGVEKIGVTDNFFELGGHSLVVAQVINRTHKQLEKTVSFKTFFANPTIKDLSKQLQKNEYTPLPVAEIMDSYPLTASQNRLWILSQMEGGSLAYNMPAAVNLKGAVDKNKLEESFKSLIDRHEILRTYFKTNNQGEVRQHIIPTENVKFAITEEDFCSVENQDEAVIDFLHEKNAEPFDLEQAPLVRASLIKLKEDEYVFFLSLHHIIGDGWSIELLIAEVVSTYNSLTQGKEIHLPKLRIQYKDYAVWLNGVIQQEEQQVSEQYWLDQFKGDLPVLELPSFKKRPLVQTYKGHNLTHHFSIEFLEKIKTFSKEQDVTLFMTLMAGINALLHRYTGQDDIIVGTPIAGREHPDLENQIGLYLNTLGIRTQFKEKNSFLDLVTLQKETLLSAYDHQNYPFDALIGKLNLKRDTSRSALFDVLVILQNQAQLNNLNTEELLNLEVSGYDFSRRMSQFDLSFTFVETNGLELSIEYNTDIYDDYLIERMFVHFENLLTELLAQPSKAIQEADYLASSEKQQLMLEFNNTDVAFSKEETLLDLFEKQVKKTPNQIAVVFEDIELTYRELNENANRLAHYLIENYTIEPDDLIGIKLERSEQILVVILGILKSGAAYVPIDVNYPKERIAYIEQDSNAKIVIDQKALEIFIKAQRKYSKENVEKINIPEDLAYIIYTSGTTGNPKGVMIEHRNAVELINWSAVEFDSAKFEIMYAVTSYCFDLSIYEFFYALSIGKKIRILRNALEIKEYVSKEDKILLNTVPSVVRQLLENKVDLKNVSLINMAGEIVPVDIVKKLQKQPIEVRNLYGPSEDTTYSTAYLIKNQEYRSILIGKPISNSQVYILDDYLNPVSIGVTGKLYVSGAGVARGYLNKPELTAEKFMNNPFIEGKRMYDTGDLGCWLPDGNIEFLGRKDQQVKLRGYRIELGEIENTILQYSEDLKQVVVEVKGENEEKVLVAYFVSATELDKSKLRSFLQNSLPDYMIPGFYIALEKLPLTPNGKIDRKALPNISGNDIIRKEYIAPESETEKILVAIWQEVLGVEKIGVTDNFFEMGGHSLVVAQVINRTHKQLEKTVSFKTFFANPTIKDLSKQLQKNEYAPLPVAEIMDSYPLTASQNRLWILSQMEGGSLAYNMPVAVNLKGAVDKNKLEESFKSLIDRHEILRTYFKTNNQGEVRQHIIPTENVKFAITEEDFCSVENQDEAVIDLLHKKNAEPFDLEQAPLVRASLIKLKENEYVFFLSLHHIIGDGWSIELLIAEVVSTYNSLTQAKEINLPKLRIQYKDYAVWLNEAIQQENNQASEKYWIQQFVGELPALNLPSFKIRPLFKTYNGSSLTHTFSKTFLEKIKAFSKEQDATLFMTLMAGINSLLYKYTGQDDIIVGTPIAGREHPDLENQFGLYLNTLAIRTQFNEKSSFLDLIALQKEILLGAYEHQSYPFSELVEKLNLKRDTSRSALFDVMMVLQNQAQLSNVKSDEEVKNLQVEAYNFKRKTAQFDINFMFAETEGLDLTIEYNNDVYDEYLIERMFVHFENLVTGLSEEPETNIEEIDYLTKSEKDQLLISFNDTIVDYPANKTLIELFEEQVEKTPNNIAVAFEEVELTYRELNEKSNQLANYLRSDYFIQADDLIGIKLDRSEKIIVSILGILKSGGAYVPIDINYPEERIAYIEKDINCKIVIDKEALEKFNKVEEKYSKDNIEIINQPHDVAYVMFTSGTTGNPKGVMVEQINVVRLVKPCSFFPLNEEKVLLSTGSISFDATIIEYFGTLLNGSKLILTKQENLLELESLKKVIQDNKVNSLWMTASWFNQVVENEINIFENISQLIVGGDIVSPAHTQKVFEKYPAIKIVNGYGPTENTTFSTTFEIKNKKYFNIPIGSPIPNSNAYILDEALNLVPTGVIGKIYVSGAGVARGYLNQPELTKEKFIQNPFIQGERMYSTGDLGRWLPDGNIEFFGRNDQQIKIRGYRVELSEIENAILEYSTELKQVVVEVKEENNKKVLAAYFVSATAIDKSKLRSFLQSRLPDYMIPSFYIALEELPLTRNGKLDRKALPGISGDDLVRKEYIAPSNEIEEKLVAIWQEVLGVEKIGVTDNFFELGGHSLNAMVAIKKIIIEFNIEVSISDFFLNKTIEGVANLIVEKRWLTTDVVTENELTI
ncbi:non-ribosomal peptide synthetase [uncultured Flavobacterium sp.]|uniref:non-ribosomal peptide synthetase n=1 Tax=uncultured Flavobacterium sp. TaxID=165435 RepID=UPI002931BD1E|nr:non-ribosomal peptide synthetase [uncultured Flavobacterium sp.]